jgi:hypothetical protein
VGRVVSAFIGEQVVHVNLPAEASCSPGPSEGSSVAVVPATAIDPTLTVPLLIATSCYSDSPTRNEIYYSNPATSPGYPATLVHTITTESVSDRGWGALGFRADHGDLLGCTSNSDGHHDVYRIDVQTGATTFMFAAPEARGYTVCEGIAWDGASQEVYVSSEVSSTRYVYSESGTLLRSFPNPNGCSTAVSGGSGLAVSGDSVYEACEGAIQVYEVIKSTPTTEITHFRSGDQRPTDIECDPVTFASLGKHVIWSREFYDNAVYAFEIPSGTCNLGGCARVIGVQPPTLNPGVDQTIVGNCSGADVAYAQPTLVNAGCEIGTTISCTRLPGASSGAHTITCTATDASGNVSAPVSFTVTVLPPLTMQIQSPLSGDATAASPDGSIDNVVKAGSVVPVSVKLFNCGADVTTSAAVSVRLGVSYKVNSSDPPNSSVTLNYSGIGDSTGLMYLVGQQYHYNLSTKSYQVTATTGNPAYYAVTMNAAYDIAPNVVVGTDAVRIETR